MGKRRQQAEPTAGASEHFTYSASAAGASEHIRSSAEENVSVDAESNFGASEHTAGSVIEELSLEGAIEKLKIMEAQMSSLAKSLLQRLRCAMPLAGIEKASPQTNGCTLGSATTSEN